MRQIRCIETGKVYDSVAAAARSLGITPAAISHVLKGRQTTAGGHTWECTGEPSPPQKRYNGLYRDRAGGVYKSLRGFAQRHGYTIRQVQSATVTDDPSPRLIDLPLKSNIQPRTMRISFINGCYLIDGLPATTYPNHPLMDEALAQARQTGETVELVRMPNYTVPRVTEADYWALVLPALEVWNGRGDILTREEHEARLTLRNTWITAHPPTKLYEGTPDRWKPIHY